MSEREITEDSWERTRGSVDSSSLFKFTKGEVEAKNIIRMVQRNIAYLKITSLEDQISGWKERQITSSAIMRRSVQTVGTHHLMMITIIPGTSSMIRGMTGNAGHQRNG